MLSLAAPGGVKLIAKYLLGLVTIYAVIKFILTVLDLGIIFVKDQTDFKKMGNNALEALR